MALIVAIVHTHTHTHTHTYIYIYIYNALKAWLDDAMLHVVKSIDQINQINTFHSIKMENKL